MNTLFDALMVVLGMIALMIVIGLLVSLPVMWLWNTCLVPAVNGVNDIGWWQAWGLIILTTLLFKSNVKSSD